jgi:hypothetical protein
VIPANWKFAADQFASDGYHVLTLHRAMKELGLFGPIEDIKQVLYGVDVSSRDGHGLRCLPSKWRATRFSLEGANGDQMTVVDKLTQMPPAGMTSEMAEQVPRNLTAEQVRLLTEYPPIVGQIFPTAAFISTATMGADFKPSASITWRTWVPRGVGQTEVLYWSMVERDAPPEVKAAVRRSTIQIHTSSGLIDQDDAEVWSGTQRVIGGVVAQTRRSTYQGLLGVNKPDDWPAGGLVYDGPSADDNEWNWWLRYQDFMTNRVR